MFKPEIQAGCIITYAGFTLKVMNRGCDTISSKDMINCEIISSGKQVYLVICHGMDVVAHTDTSIEVI